ncbi:MAG: alpha/beta fold hydrolase [Acidimicrobiales bacterium]
MYTAHPDRPDVAKAFDYMRGLLEADQAAAKAWEENLYQTIDLRPVLAAIRCRVLIVAGDLDFLCRPAQARTIAAAVPGARLVVIPDWGYVPSVEAPKTYQEAVLSFLAA